MKDYENRLSDYIDALNEERKPKEHEEASGSEEFEELLDTVRMVRSLREPAMPGSDFKRKLAVSIAGQVEGERGKMRKKKRGFTAVASAIAAVLIMALIINSFFFNKTNYAYAMEKAFEGVEVYHGVLKIVSENELGEHMTQSELEVWADKSGRYYVKQLSGFQEGVVTVNNGEKKWQIVPEGSAGAGDEGKVYIYPAFPDAYRFSFELGKEIQNVKKAVSCEVIGEEKVAGRDAAILEVKPQGGEIYRLWVDKETKLPLKKESAWSSGLRYTLTYANIEFMSDIPAELMAYSLPKGYSEVNSNDDFMVTNIKEAEGLTGFEVSPIEKIPDGYMKQAIAVSTEKNIVKLYFASKEDKNIKVVLLQGKADGEFKPSSGAVLGKIGDADAEIQSPVSLNSGIIGSGIYGGVTDLSSIRWIMDGKEYAVVGNAPMEIISQFAASLAKSSVEMPEPESGGFKPQIEVPVDMEIVKNEQKSVDAGHSPWQLDLKYVAQVFVSLKISPEGIVGDYPVDMEDLNIIYNDGAEAVIEVNSEDAPVRKVYLKRLVRQDETGIWTVVGYDPA